MKADKKFLGVLAGIAILAVVGFLAISGGDGKGGINESRSLTISGSTTVLPFAQQAADEFVKKNILK